MPDIMTQRCLHSSQSNCGIHIAYLTVYMQYSVMLGLRATPLNVLLMNLVTAGTVVPPILSLQSGLSMSAPP